MSGILILLGSTVGINIPLQACDMMKVTTLKHHFSNNDVCFRISSRYNISDILFTHFSMVNSRMMFSMIISSISRTFFPGEFEFFSVFSISQPM